jgi:hypothetical protein
MPAMDFCNTMEFPIAILWNFNLQLSVFLFYNKHGSEKRIEGTHEKMQPYTFFL